MALVLRNNKTGLKTEYDPWNCDAFDVLKGKKYTREMSRMREIRYLGNDRDMKTETYGRICDVQIGALKQTRGIPKLDCVGIRPADMSLLQMFKTACEDGFCAETLTADKQRFVLKGRWYRIFDTNGCIVPTDQNTLRKVLTPGRRIDIEYHMNYIRVVGVGEDGTSGNPIVRKITLLN
jgi:hypothetical protein